MPGMKITVDAAMRARDVSRPCAEHEALADASEPQPAPAREHGQDAVPGGSAAAASEVASATGTHSATLGATPGGASKGRSPRRRRRRR